MLWTTAGSRPRKGNDMKRILVLAILLFSAPCWAVDTFTTTYSDEWNLSNVKKRMITWTWIDDGGDGMSQTITWPAYSVNNGWVLYYCVSNPGSTAPTDLYDITLTDSDGVDVMGAALTNLSSSTAEQIVPTYIFPMIAGSWTWTLSGNAEANATGSVKCFFQEN